ncbi:MAG: methylglyoxal synthase [Clostridiales bacterium]|jgi:methylglyoxal synthase|nr:methylglyoxal synthase [Clostridiales bacterium]
MNIGLVAHDNKKTLMEDLCIAYRNILLKHTLFATGTTGSLIEKATGLYVNKYLAGHLGGEQQLGAQIAQNDIDLVIFLHDPTKMKSYEPKLDSTLRLCDVYNIPFATNIATAEALLLALDKGDLDWRTLVEHN